MINLLLHTRKNGAPATICCPYPIRIFPFATFSLSRHPITQQPAKSSVRSAAQLECGNWSWLEVRRKERFCSGCVQNTNLDWMVSILGGLQERDRSAKIVRKIDKEYSMQQWQIWLLRLRRQIWLLGRLLGRLCRQIFGSCGSVGKLLRANYCRQIFGSCGFVGK